METKNYKFMYVLRDGETNNYKIGITKNLNRRLSQLQTGCPHELEIMTVWKHTQMEIIRKYERVLHRYYKKIGCQVNTQGEWFELTEDEVFCLCQPKTIQEQNIFIEETLQFM